MTDKPKFTVAHFRDDYYFISPPEPYDNYIVVELRDIIDPYTMSQDELAELYASGGVKTT